MDPNKEIVISGISGRYPDCDNLDQLRDALFQKLDLISDDYRRFEPGIYNTPRRTGKINGLEYFDSGYFGISPRQSEMMDPQHRIICETVFEAIVDAGYNPKELRGTKTGVYVGMCNFDSTDFYMDHPKTLGYSVLGHWLGLLPNRISFCFDFKGPSFCMDTACSSSMIGMTLAVKALENGDIDNAIVAGVKVNLHPYPLKELVQMNAVSCDSQSRVYGKYRNGYVRSEGAVTILLQKQLVARRLYATVLGCEMNNDGYKQENITFPSSAMQSDLIRTIYNASNIDVNDVSYVEMHGTGTPSGDISECQSIVDSFCQNRKTPLLVGSVKSNVGHAEVSSGLISLSKVLIAMETGVIPANINCESLDYTLPGLNDGRMQVIEENTPWNGGIVSINNFGIGGSNVHCIVRSNPKSKLPPNKREHRLVQVSGRTEESVKYYLEQIDKHKDDDEFLALIDAIHKMNVEGHMYRGYSVLGDESSTEIGRIPNEKRPIVFIYAGMGCQWTGMGRDLMKIDVFRKTFKECVEALRPHHPVDLEEIVLSPDPAMFENTINSLVAITATQIGLTEVLKSMGIVPDIFGGHSLGEVGCAYCNGDITIEQAMLLSFLRGYATSKSKLGPKGQMASIGLSKEECSKLLPEGVYIACVNTSNNVTISGLKEDVLKFVDDLTKKNIFTRLVKSAGNPYHSKYLSDSAEILLKMSYDVLPDPKPRSPKWISSSWDEKDWDNPKAKLNCPEYHYNNYSHHVKFDQVLKRIPKDAVVIEIAPHGLLTSLIKKEVGPGITCLNLANRTCTDNVKFLYANIGKLYLNGGQPNLRTYYNNVTFPVGRGTPTIAPMIKWDHSIKWCVPYFDPNKTFEKRISVNTKSEDYDYLNGYYVNGRMCMPAAAYLELVWKTLAFIYHKEPNNLPITFESVKFIRPVHLTDENDTVFIINILKLSGAFEVFESGKLCCKGTARISENNSRKLSDAVVSESPDSLTKIYVYKLLCLKGFNFSGVFQGIETIDIKNNTGEIKWSSNITSVLDSMFQILICSENGFDLSLPAVVEKVTFDPNKYFMESTKKNISVMYDTEENSVFTKGIEIINVDFMVQPKASSTENPIMQRTMLVPYGHNYRKYNMSEAPVMIALQIIQENITGKKYVIQAIEIVSKTDNSIKDIVPADLNIEFFDESTTPLDLIVVDQVDTGITNLKNGGFLLYFGDQFEDIQMELIYSNCFEKRGIYLFRYLAPSKTKPTIIKMEHNHFEWVEQVKTAIDRKVDEVILLSIEDEISGIEGLVRSLNTEGHGNTIFRCIFIKHKNSGVVSLDSPLCQKQLAKKLVYNIFDDGIWGRYQFFPVQEMSEYKVFDACFSQCIPGDLSTFKWEENRPCCDKYSDSNDYVYVFYSALNSRDATVASAQRIVKETHDLEVLENQIGFEYSGVTKGGKRVMGLTLKGLSLQLIVDPLFTWNVPASWILEQAATVPAVYLMSYYALIEIGQIQDRESVLIYGGDIDVTMAAVSVALSINCEVFVMLNAKKQREALLVQYPQLKPDHIGTLASLKHVIRTSTEGKGVNVILNLLANFAVHSLAKCLSQGGKFLDIRMSGLWEDTHYIDYLLKKVSKYYKMSFDDIFACSTTIKKRLSGLLHEGLRNGVVTPIPRLVYGVNKIEDAFKLLTSQQQTGKIIMTIREETAAMLKSPNMTVEAIPKLTFSSEGTYIFNFGSISSFGLALIDFLISRGARKIILNSKKATDAYLMYYLRNWSSIKGLIIEMKSSDTASLVDAKELIEYAGTLGTVKGVFNFPSPVDEDLFNNSSSENFQSYINFCLDMDQAIRFCPVLDWFVVFTMATVGHSTAKMLNSAIEMICERRQKNGLPGLAIRYGPIQNEQVNNVSGLIPQSIPSCLKVVETFMLQPFSSVSSCILSDQDSEVETINDPIIEIIARQMGIKHIESIDKDQSLLKIGLDSLMASDIKESFKDYFNIEINVEAIRDLTFNKITKMCQNSGLAIQSASPGKINSDKPEFDLAEVNGLMLSTESVLEIINDPTYTTKIFMVHPIEGHVKALIPLARRLKANVYGLQCTAKSDTSSIMNLAKEYENEIKRIQPQGPYVLCGYSYGSAMAFEISVKLEKEGHDIKLFFLDSSPYFIKESISRNFKYNTPSEDMRMMKVLKYFVNTFGKIDAEMNGIFSSSASVDTVVQKMATYLSHKYDLTFADVVASANSLMNRIKTGYSYETTEILKGKAVLFRATAGFFSDLVEDYNLQERCLQPIRLERIPGNHLEILYGEGQTKIANIINELLC